VAVHDKICTLGLSLRAAGTNSRINNGLGQIYRASYHSAKDMLNWNIHKRLLFYSFVPLTIIASLLAAFFISEMIADSNANLDTRGHALARHLATASTHGVASNQPDKLNPIITTMMQEPDVLSATIIDNSGAVVNREQDPGHASHLKPTIDIGPDENHLIFMQPIIVDNSEASPGTNNNNVIGWAIIEMSKTPSRAQQFITSRKIILVTLGLILLSGILIFALSAHITKPIIALTGAANEIEKGNFDIYIKTGAGGELQGLERSLNNIAVASKNSRIQLQERIDRATNDLLNSLQIVERQNKELTEARQQALLASRVKSEFLANMSHEIRTPMNGILGFIKLLRKTSLNSEQQDHINTIEKSANNLLGIINDILDISKIEAGKIKLQSVDYNLRECIEDVIALLAPSAHDKQLNLVSLIYNDVPLELLGDETKLRQIITNLVSNAIKFTQQGHIIVRTMLEDEYDDHIKIKVSISDTGIGISQKDMHRLFSTFEQIDPSSTKKFGGTGLGLAISKTLAELMQGEIGVDSQPGQGSTFWFSFVHKRSTVAKPESKKKSLATTNPIRGFKALYYEPSNETAMAHKHLLENWGLDVTSVRMFPDLIREIENTETLAPYDILILGLSHKECHAEQIAEHINRIRTITQTSILALANSVETKTLDRIRQQGVQACLPKPIRYHDFYLALSSLLTPDTRLLSLGNKPANLQDETTTEPDTTRHEQQTNRLDGLHILVAEDNKINAKLIKTILSQLGARVTIASNGKQAIDIFAKHEFDLILMDIHMPELNGLETTRRIREQESPDQHTPIFALTADAMPDDQENFRVAGMDEVLIKPFDEQQLLQYINKYITHMHESATAQATATPKTDDAGGDELPQTDAPTKKPEKPEKPDPGRQTRILSAQLYHTLIDELPEYRHRINEAFHNREFDRLQEVAHKLHGHTSYCNVPMLKSVVQLLERAARGGKAEEIRKCLLSVNDEITLLIQTASQN
jgi:two-component system sensor histidine kinase BarA